MKNQQTSNVLYLFAFSIIYLPYYQKCSNYNPPVHFSLLQKSLFFGSNYFRANVVFIHYNFNISRKCIACFFNEAFDRFSVKLVNTA